MGHRLRHTYGHGAAKLTLAPAFTPSPYARALTLSGDLAGGLEELRKAGPGRIAARIALTGGGGLAAALALAFLLSPFFVTPPDSGETQIVMAMPEPEEEELLPEPEPQPVIPEPLPEPEVIAQEEPEPLPEPEPARPEPEPEPVKVAKKPPPLPPLPAMPAPVEPPKEFVPTPAPVRVAREPVKQPPKVVSIDPLSPVPAVPSEEPAPAPKTTRVAKAAPAANRPALPALADFAPIGDPAPAGAPASVASRAVRTNVVARNNTPANRPVAFAAAAPAGPPAAFDEHSAAPALATRSTVKRPTSTTAAASSRPQSLGFNAGTPSAEAADVTPQAVGRTERTLPQRSAGGGQGENLAGVPLGSLAACATDREEDERKMAVLSAVRGRTECSSAAGRYRFVETKNLNAFLMWIERAPSRRAADRCVELRLALECLGG